MNIFFSNLKNLRIKNPAFLQTISLCIFSFGICLSVSIMEIGLFLTFFFILLKRFKLNEIISNLFDFINSNSILFFWFLYIFSGYLSALMGISLKNSLNEMNSDVIKLFFLMVLLCSISESNKKHVLNWYLIGAAIAATIGILQYIYFHHYIHISNYRSNGTMNTITYAEVLSSAGLLALSSVLFCPSKEKNKFYLTVFILILIALVFSSSRGPIAGLFLSLGILLFLTRISFQRKFVILLLTIGFACFLFAFGHSFRNRVGMALKSMKWIISEDEKFKPIKLGGDKDRRELWETGAKIYKDVEWLGVGPGNIKKVFDFYHPRPMVNTGGINPKFSYSNVHNLFLQQMAERGRVGAFFLILFFVVVFLVSIINFKHTKTNINAWLVCLIPGFIIMNITETSFEHATVAGGLVLALSLLEIRKINVKVQILALIMAGLISCGLWHCAHAISEVKTIKVFNGPFYFWDGEKKVDVKYIENVAPPMLLFENKGKTVVFKHENGISIDIDLLPKENNSYLKIGYDDHQNYFPFKVEPGKFVEFIGRVTPESLIGNRVYVVIADIGLNINEESKLEITTEMDGRFYLRKKIQKSNLTTFFYLEIIPNREHATLDWTEANINIH